MLQIGSPKLLVVILKACKGADIKLSHLVLSVFVSGIGVMSRIRGATGVSGWNGTGYPGIYLSGRS